MIPKSLSATSLQVAGLCMARWETEYLNRTPGFSNFAANIGTACHGGLEKFVEAVFIKKTHEWSWELLKQFYQISYIETFKSADFETPEYKDGEAMLKKWMSRTSFDGVTVETVEVKETIPIPFQHPEGANHQPCENCEENPKRQPGICFIPFNYIMDRVDRLSETEFRVVDYKTVRVPIDPTDLKGKVQARAYALAIQIKYPEATKIRVVFDLLRHDPVGIVVTREDNIAFWHYLKNEAQRIVNTSHAEVEPTLNMECGYCVMKATCPILQKNINGGGVHSLSIGELVQKKVEIEAANKGNKYLLEEIEELLLKEAVNRDVLSWRTEDETFDVEITMSRRRQVDASEVARIIGPEKFSKMGSITLGVVDELLKDESLSTEQRAELKSLIYYKTGDPKAKVKPVSKLV